MASERRLIAIEFIPDEDGGRWEPVSPRGSEHPWLDAWEAGLTEKEVKALRIATEDVYIVQPDDEPHPNAYTRVWRKLRAFSDPLPEEEQG